ncbi:unnamed protein product [Notodromas monacha]|uniref:Cas1p 10 TM acyl transferase domain-containing protein n=1 Tax=Notodromas monacha TaxID=399045 RepID=A0A7R9BH22_9CRUS|nr:unnamed protein product [Notodromas monacha]CAG0914265.1 unnamed protein product [Notodromas monacha]
MRVWVLPRRALKRSLRFSKRFLGCFRNMSQDLCEPLLESPPSKPGPYSATDIIQMINIRNAKLVAILLIAGFVFYHGALHVTYGADSCKWLLSDGRFQGNNVWQSYGCMMHTYTPANAQMCMEYLSFLHQKNKIVFVGDSRTRDLYFQFLRHFGFNEDVSNWKREERHKDHTFSAHNLNLEVHFKWRPIVNDSWIQMIDEFYHEEPTLTIASAGSWQMKKSNGSADGLMDFKVSFTSWAAKADDYLAAKPRARLIWSLQDPVDAENLEPSRRMVTNELIDEYNMAAMDILKANPRIWVWSSARLVTQGMMSGGSVHTDGLHLINAPKNIHVQMLLNLYCNDKMNYEDGTCCSAADKVTVLQKITFGFFGYCFFAWLASSMWKRMERRSRTPTTNGNVLPSTGNCGLRASGREDNLEKFIKVHGAFLRFGLILVYGFLCDRTTFFMKDNKYFTNLNFWLPFGYLFALGIFFTAESKFTQVLHRDQTDEWKGWMQLVILIYHMTGASRILPIYMHMRILVSAYLFLSGFGHFTYFFKKGDFGLSRFFQVMFRMNFLVFGLCLMMNRPFQFYYFVPLISYWYAVTYVVFALPPRVTAMSCDAKPYNYLYVVLKLVAMLAFSSILYTSEVFFERIFVTRPWKALFVTPDDDIHEWWFRWSLDRYSMAYGAIFGLGYHLVHKYHLVDDSNHSNLWTRGWTLAFTLLATLGMGAYTTFTFFCRSKPECNEVHSYVVFVPLLAFVVLRNVSGVLRTRYSTMFAWFGKISLELFVGQFHMWLAADTHGVLVLVPSYPVANVLVTSFIFVCLAHEIHRVTEVLTPLLVPNDWKPLLRNFLIFLCILIPIGIQDGMF